MAETDPKSVQDLTNVVSPRRVGQLALATIYLAIDAKLSLAS